MGLTKWKFYVKSTRDEKRDCEICLANLCLMSSEGKQFKIDYHFGVLDKKREMIFKSTDASQTSDELSQTKGAKWLELFSFDEFMVKRSQLMDENRGVKFVCKVCRGKTRKIQNVLINSSRSLL